VRRLAPAKVNLALHVTGRRPDGRHLLDSLVVFAGIGDRLGIEPADALSLSVTGPTARGVPEGADNLVWKAAEAFGAAPGAALALEKHLPRAGGVGGGASDAAAALAGLSDLWNLPLPDADAVLALGADVPVCLHGRACRMSGVGDVLAPLPPLPPLAIVLANCGDAVPTGPVFRALARRDNPPLPPPLWRDAGGFFAWLRQTRNDLEAPARALAPGIGAVLERLRARPGCLFSRMSGSGGTCFGLFARPEDAANAARTLRTECPRWWAAAGAVLP